MFQAAVRDIRVALRQSHAFLRREYAQAYRLSRRHRVGDIDVLGNWAGQEQTRRCAIA